MDARRARGETADVGEARVNYEARPERTCLSVVVNRAERCDTSDSLPCASPLTRPAQSLVTLSPLERAS